MDTLAGRSAASGGGEVRGFSGMTLAAERSFERSLPVIQGAGRARGGGERALSGSMGIGSSIAIGSGALICSVSTGVTLVREHVASQSEAPTGGHG